MTDSSSGYLDRSVTNTVESSAATDSYHVQSSTGYAYINNNNCLDDSEHFYLMLDTKNQEEDQQMEETNTSSSIPTFLFEKNSTTLTSLNPVYSDDDFLNFLGYTKQNLDRNRKISFTKAKEIQKPSKETFKFQPIVKDMDAAWKLREKRLQKIRYKRKTTKRLAKLSIWPLKYYIGFVATFFMVIFLVFVTYYLILFNLMTTYHQIVFFIHFY
jgi:hypothetical protein